MNTEPKKIELNEKNVLVQETETQFTWIEKNVSEKWGAYELKTELHTSQEAANIAAGIACKNWGSNLVYLGTLQYEINGQIFYNPTFNVWD